MALQSHHFTRQLLDSVKRHDTNFGIFKRYCIAGVDIFHNAVKADDFTRHLKASDLIASILGRNRGFEKTGADRKQRRKFFSVAVQPGTPFDLAANRNNVLYFFQLIGLKTHGHAQFTQIAAGASNLDRKWMHRRDFDCAASLFFLACICKIWCNFRHEILLKQTRGLICDIVGR